MLDKQRPSDRFGVYVLLAVVLVVLGFFAGMAQFAHEQCGSFSANCALESMYRGILGAMGGFVLGVLAAVVNEYRLARRRSVG